MGYPLDHGTDSGHAYSFYQALIGGEIVATLALLMTLQSIHYFAWGHEQQLWEHKREEEGDGAVQALPKSQWKWDQKSFNMYFAIMVGNHVSALILPLAYYPSVVTTCLAYTHLALLLSSLINSVLMDQKETGKGGKSLLNRIFWTLMCLINLTLIVSGLSGVPTVIA